MRRANNCRARIAVLPKAGGVTYGERSGPETAYSAGCKFDVAASFVRLGAIRGPSEVAAIPPASSLCRP